MRFTTVLVLSLCCSIIFGQKKSHKLAQFSKTGKTTFCPVKDEVVNHYVPFKNKYKYLRVGKPAEFNVAYIGPVPNTAREAIENGVFGILSELISSPIPINVEVNWEELDEGQLAGAGPTGYYSNVTNSPHPDQVYPIALAEKLIRANINGEDADVSITVNSGAEWYYDYNNPSGIGNNFDFVGILLHEVFHGLGFSAVVGEQEGSGFVRPFDNGQAWSIYTEKIINATGSKITEFPEGTSELLRQLTSDNLFFDLLHDEPAKLYAPSTFDPGSSISHLDEIEYSNTESSLMTPFAARGRVERHPGLGLDILLDMGWDMTYMLHAPSEGSEDFDVPLNLEMELISDLEVDPSTIEFHYSTDEFASEDIVVAPTLDPSTGRYTVTIPAPGEEITYQYYFKSTNARGTVFTNPGQAPKNYFEYVFALDMQVPRVDHERVQSINNKESSIEIVAEITDFFTGLDSAIVFWRINQEDQTPVIMERQLAFGSTDEFSDIYIAALEFPNGALNAGDVLEYSIYAVDKSKAANSAKLPFNGFVSITVEEVLETQVSYINDFNSETSDFSGNGFTITRAAGFSSNAINSSHPYPEAGQGNTLNFVYELSVPIRIKESDALIEFNEVVIVEPGDPGTSFGDDEFWDYVIVEGKKIGETEWKEFLPGYDCDSHSAWRNQYDANSQRASANLLRERKIDMTENGNFSAGDEIFIRFRLFSDPFANGWGWLIDDLEIQKSSVAVEDFVENNHFEVYPNPVDNGLLNLNLELKQSVPKAKLVISNLLGQQVLTQNISLTKNANTFQVDVSSFPKGLYLVSIHFNGKDQLTKKFIK